MESGYVLKDILFNEKVVDKIASDIYSVHPEFDKTGFERSIKDKMFPLSLTQRSDLAAQAMEQFLPSDFEEAVDILERSFGPELASETIEGYNGLYHMPHGTFIAKNGLDWWLPQFQF